ncbi:hypothetical protein PACTADRAFT_48286 [Pachysolen tannophilus NRRL Y-2460]|uniref:Uncharacterized protein n=1 Tax=Pachysolen tannophilus NRRL Y-2460 TaxID=669874 RepID=A0A1E4U3I1_PACTA|nr:hypothetical protein PACTADRAFT_48286 [Pachysolen tannophilus NRRL Y-2460]
MSKTATPVPPEAYSSVKSSSVLVALTPVRDSLVSQLRTLVENSYKDLTNTIISEPIFDNEDITNGEFMNIISPLDAENLVEHKKLLLEVSFLHSITCIIDEYFHGIENDKDNNNKSLMELNLKLFILLDLSIYSTTNDHSANDLPYEIISNISLKTNKSFLIKFFGYDLFVNKSSAFRRLRLKNNCNHNIPMRSITRPGIVLITMYNELIQLLKINYEEETLKFLGSLRIFISDCFKWSDESLNNKNYECNKHENFELKLKQELKGRYKKDPFFLFYTLRELFVDPYERLKNIKVNHKQFDKYKDAIADLIELVIKEDLYDRKKRKTPKNDLFEIKESKIKSDIELEEVIHICSNFMFDPSITTSETLFNKYFQTFKFRQYIMVNIFFIVSIYMDLNSETFEKESSRQSNDHIKISKDDSLPVKYPFTTHIDNRPTMGFFFRYKKEIQRHYKNMDEQFFFTISNIVDGNKIWFQWKKSGFDIEIFNKNNGITQDKIIKSIETIEKNSKYRPKFQFRYGARELTNIFENYPSGLNQLEEKIKARSSRNVQLENFKKEIAEVTDLLENKNSTLTVDELEDLQNRKE